LAAVCRMYRISDKIWGDVGVQGLPQAMVTQERGNLRGVMGCAASPHSVILPPLLSHFFDFSQYVKRSMGIVVPSLTARPTERQGSAYSSQRAWKNLKRPSLVVKSAEGGVNLSFQLCMTWKDQVSGFSGSGTSITDCGSAGRSVGMQGSRTYSTTSTWSHDRGVYC
jgi:hypothetical protein